MALGLGSVVRVVIVVRVTILSMVVRVRVVVRKPLMMLRRGQFFLWEDPLQCRSGATGRVSQRLGPSYGQDGGLQGWLTGSPSSYIHIGHFSLEPWPL